MLQAERSYSEQQSTYINKAYSTLFRPLSRGLYLLELHHQPLGDATELPAEFLQDILEKRERLAEVDSATEVALIKAENQAAIHETVERIEGAFGKHDLKAARWHLVQLTYYMNICEKVLEMESRFDDGS